MHVAFLFFLHAQVDSRGIACKMDCDQISQVSLSPYAVKTSLLKATKSNEKDRN